MGGRDDSGARSEAQASHILVIDDEEVVHVSLDRILGRRGHRVEAVLTAAEGLERLASKRYDLVITDLMMPEMTGLELLERMKELGLTTPTLMITGYPTIKTALQALRLGATDYLAKPFTRMELLGPVARALSCSDEGPVGSIRDTLVPPDEEASAGDGVEPPTATLAAGERVHLRRHSWGVYNQDGTMDVGIGASFLAAIGEVESLVLPTDADLVEQGYVGMRLTTVGGEEHGVFMPLSGRVVAVNAEAASRPRTIGPDTWLVRIVPDRLTTELPLLVRG